MCACGRFFVVVGLTSASQYVGTGYMLPHRLLCELLQVFKYFSSTLPLNRSVARLFVPRNVLQCEELSK